MITPLPKGRQLTRKQKLQAFTGNGICEIYVTNSRVGRKTNKNKPVICSVFNLDVSVIKDFNGEFKHTLTKVRILKSKIKSLKIKSQFYS